MRNALQLGLYTAADWAFLTQEDWVKEMETQRPQHQLPNIYTDDPSPFRYFGVDVSPDSINAVRENYKDYDNVFFLVCGVGDKHAIQNFPNKFYDMEINNWYEFHKEKKDALFVFMPLSFLIENLGIEELALLAVDIDGHEDEAFHNISDWKIKPELITIEISSLWMETEEHPKKIVDAGYTHIKTIPQFTGDEIRNYTQESADPGIMPYQHEQQFLRNDVYEKNKDKIQIEHFYRHAPYTDPPLETL